jgi:hypothetical protein
MVILYIVLGMLAVVILRIALRTRINRKAINEGENLIQLALASMATRGYETFAKMEGVKLENPSFANDMYLITGKSYLHAKELGSNSSPERYAEKVATTLIEHYRL